MSEYQKTLMKWEKRREKIYKMHDPEDGKKGMSYTEISRVTGLSPARIGQICASVRLNRKRENGTE